MNNLTRTEKNAGSAQQQHAGKLSDLQKIMKLAINSFSKEKYPMAVDYCRKAVEVIPATGRPDLVAEVYYLWCLSCFKMGKHIDAKKVCYEARLKLGNYLDLVYFEIIIAAVNEEMERIPKLVDNYTELYLAAGGEFDPLKEKTHAKFGEVMLICGQALEQSENLRDALDIYNKYLGFFPEDSAVKKHLAVLENRQNGSNGN